VLAISGRAEGAAERGGEEDLTDFVMQSGIPL
jgi:hypothetical protein